MKRIRAIAFYLPQFHPVPENDLWWGKGFTEWTNVAKAKPMFKGHYQPHLPADLGFYDLRLAEVREQQAALAKNYGIEGFCYWHYWFGNNRQVLERPFNEVLSSGKPDLPFCLAWANESWTGIWHGLQNEVLIEQTYSGKEGYIAHFEFLIKAFKDPRYIRVDGKPLFVVYLPESIPDLPVFVHTFREQARLHGLAGIHLVATNVSKDWKVVEKGFDAITLSNHSKLSWLPGANKWVNRYRNLLHRPKLAKLYKQLISKPRHTYAYEEAMKHFVNKDLDHELYYPMVIPNWDNTPRSGRNGFVLTGSTPELFRTVLESAAEVVENYPEEQRIVFIKSWNEWAKGNHLEPDQKFGHRYLEVIRDVLSGKK